MNVHSSTKLGDRLAVAAVAAALALPLPARAAAQIYAESSTVKVQPTDPPKAAKTARIAAAKNEFEAFQVVVRADGAAVTQVTARASALNGPGSIPASAVRLYREEYLQVTTPSGSIGKAGRWPDGLVPAVDDVDGQARNAFPFDVPAGESRAVWVEVLVPPTAAAGLYRGAVQLTGDGLSAEVPVELEVYDFQLPSTPTLATAFLLFSGAACAEHTGSPDCGGEAKAAALVSKYARLALDHRITLPNVFVLRSQGDDWTDFDAAFAPLLDGTAPTRLSGARMTSAQYMGDRGQAPFSAFARHFRQRGWFDRLYDYTADEPPYGAQWSQVPARAAQAKAADAQLKVLVTTNIDLAKAHGVDGHVDIMVPVVNHMQSTTAPYVGSQRPKYDPFVAGGRTLWMYQSCMSFGCSFGGAEPGASWPAYVVDVPALRNRLMQWADFEMGVSGELYYETVNAYSGDPWQSQYQFSGNGDGTLFYPGRPSRIGGSTEVPLPSLRLKMIRDGVEDFEYLSLVSRLGDPAFAKQVAARVLPNLYSADQRDPTVLERARAELAARILALRGAAAGAPQPPPLPKAPPPPEPGSPDGTGARPPGAGGGCGGSSSAPGAPLAALAPLAAAVMLARRRARG